MRQDMSHGPIEAEHLATMNAVAGTLLEVFPTMGFTLLVFPLNNPEGRMNYISNARREDMLVAMKEFIANMEGRVMPPSYDLECLRNEDPAL